MRYDFEVCIETYFTFYFFLTFLFFFPFNSTYIQSGPRPPILYFTKSPYWLLEKRSGPLQSRSIYVPKLNFLTYLLTYSMEKSPSWEANLLSASQEIMLILWNPEGSLPHSQVPATSPSPEPTPSNSYPPHPTPWRSNLLLSSHLRLCLQTGLITSRMQYIFVAGSGWNT